jgi:hypothetical protein
MHINHEKILKIQTKCRGEGRVPGPSKSRLPLLLLDIGVFAFLNKNLNKS